VFGGNVSADNFIGNISYSFIQNAPWLLMIDQRYNDTSLISSIGNFSANNASLWYGINNAGSKIMVNNTKYAYINETIAQATNITKLCISTDCTNYQETTKNTTGVYLTWY
jgi:hypothetical protein